MSYLDRKNILSEGFFDSLKKFFNRPKLSKQEKKMMKDPKVKDAVKRFNDAHDKLQNRLKELDKKYGFDK
jgi:hypothetical protein